MPKKWIKKAKKHDGGNGSSHQTQRLLRIVEDTGAMLPEEGFEATATPMIFPRDETGTSAVEEPDDNSKPRDISEMERCSEITNEEIKKFEKPDADIKEQLARPNIKSSTEKAQENKALPGVEGTKPCGEKLYKIPQAKYHRVPEEPPDLTELEKQVRQLCRDYDPLEKVVEKGDIIESLDKLTLPEEDVNTFILPVMKKEEKARNAWSVMVYDIRGRECRMTLEYRPNTKKYRLTRGWWEFSRTFDLIPSEDTVELWTFNHYSTNKLSIFIAVSTKIESDTESGIPDTTGTSEGPSGPSELECQIRLLCEKEKPLEKQLDNKEVSGLQNTLDLPWDDFISITWPIVHQLLNAKHRPDKSQRYFDFYDPFGKKYHMRFRKESNCVGLIGWRKFCGDYNLIANEDFVRLWAFRHYRTQELCFLLGVETRKASKSSKKIEKMEHTMHPLDRMKKQMKKKKKQNRL